MIRIEFTSPKKNSHAAELGGSPKATFEHDPRHKTCLDGNGPLAFEVENHVVKYVQNLCKSESAQVVPRGAGLTHVAALQPIQEPIATPRRVLVPVPVPVVPSSVPVPDATGGSNTRQRSHRCANLMFWHFILSQIVKYNQEYNCRRVKDGKRMVLL